jgi:hypothetical protein
MRKKFVWLLMRYSGLEVDRVMGVYPSDAKAMEAAEADNRLNPSCRYRTEKWEVTRAMDD